MEKSRKQQVLNILKSKVSTPTLIRFKNGWFAGGKAVTDEVASTTTGTKIIFTKPNHDEK